MDKAHADRWNLQSLPSGAITGLLQQWSEGDQVAEADLFESVYGALRERASYYLRREQGQTLQTGDLVNEVYLRLQGDRRFSFPDRGAFFAFAARLMRFVLVERARGRNRDKRGGGERAQTLDPSKVGGGGLSLDPATLLALNESIEALGRRDTRLACIVEMRYFGGMTNQEIAQALKLSDRTIGREWNMARRWLTRHLKDNEQE